MGRRKTKKRATRKKEECEVSTTAAQARPSPARLVPYELKRLSSRTSCAGITRDRPTMDDSDKTVLHARCGHHARLGLTAPRVARHGHHRQERACGVHVCGFFP